MGKNVKKKRRRFLQKRARRTIASLLLVSALIVSLIPTQQKTQAYVNPDENVMSLDDVITNYAVVDTADTSVTTDTSRTSTLFPY